MKALDLLMNATKNLDDNKKTVELLQGVIHELKMMNNTLFDLLAVRVASLVESIKSGNIKKERLLEEILDIANEVKAKSMRSKK
ncbi:MAG: hypothetical protein QXK76_01655 [Candidatus Woesearchaeota archaeon]